MEPGSALEIASAVYFLAVCAAFWWARPRSWSSGWRAIAALCLAIRLIPIVLFPDAAEFDLESYRLVGTAVLEGRDVYTAPELAPQGLSSPARYPYLPGWDLIAAAARISPAAVNFMATHARGLICAPITPEAAARLGLPAMVRENREAFTAHFTVSVDAAALRLFEDAGSPIPSYEGRRVRVRGWVKSWNGPMIDATHPEQIEVLEE